MKKIYKNKYKSYFNNNLLKLAKFYQKNGYKVYHKENKSTNLHNIYYRYLTNCYKSGLKNAYIRNIDFNVKIDDATFLLFHSGICDANFS